MNGLTVMIVGKGGREHTLSRAYEESSQVGRIVVVPGNGLIDFNGKKEVIVNDNCVLDKPESILALAEEYKPDLVDVANDPSLAAGTTDLLRKKGFSVFGPSKTAARIETDKIRSRNFMARHGIPHPVYEIAYIEERTYNYINSIYAQSPGKILFIKISELYEGKGAFKVTSKEEAIEKLSELYSQKKLFLIEEEAQGEEVSVFTINNGKQFGYIGAGRDNKRLYDGAQGPQTGGMGAHSLTLEEKLKKSIEYKTIEPALRGMESEATPFKGILYTGAMIDEQGDIKVIEYNARWGDPEAQVIVPSIENYFGVVQACVSGEWESIEQDDKVRVAIVAAAKEYPTGTSKGKEITGIEEIMQLPNVNVYGAGVEQEDGKLYTNGGRILSIVGEGDTLNEARGIAYDAIGRLKIDGGFHYRTDIGKEVVFQ